MPQIPPEPNESRSVPEKAVDYFTTNAERMRYSSFRAQGMRWTPEGLDAVLALRTSVLNETYDEFWEEQPRLVA